MSLSTAFKESLRKPTFLVVLLVLLVGAVGINGATSAMKLHFRKEALPLRAAEGLDALPDKVDTVPHVPDRCYVADGFQPASYVVQDWELGTYDSGSSRKVPVRFIDFDDQTSRGAQSRCVSYFFHANGQYLDDPNQVRIK